MKGLISVEVLNLGDHRFESALLGRLALEKIAEHNCDYCQLKRAAQLVANAREIQARDLIKSVERTIVSSYDHELAQFRYMKRFGWAAVALALLAGAATIFATETYKELLALLAGVAALGWLVSRAEWQSTRRQIALLERELGAHGIYVGGRGREVYLTMNAYDNAWGDAVGEWLRSPLPNES